MFFSTDYEATVPHRVQGAMPRGGLFWITPEFQEDLVMRNGLSKEKEEDLDNLFVHLDHQILREQEEAYAASLEVDEDEEDEKFFAIPWIDHDYDSVGSFQIIMRALYLVARENPDYKVECFEDEEAIQIVAAMTNPYVKRLLVQSVEDFVDTYPLPEYTHTEDTALGEDVNAANENSKQKRGRKLSKTELGEAENKCFKAWVENIIVTPDDLSDNHVSAEIMPVPVASAVIVTPVNDNEENNSKICLAS